MIPFVKLCIAINHIFSTKLRAYNAPLHYSSLLTVMSHLSLDRAATMSSLWVSSSTRRMDGGGSSRGPFGTKSCSEHWIFKLCNKHWRSFYKLNDTMLFIL